NELQAETSFSFYSKSWLIRTQSVHHGLAEQPVTLTSQNSLRLMWDHFEDDVSLQLHYEVSPVYSDQPNQSLSNTLAADNQVYRISDPVRAPVSGRHHVVYQNLDRLNLRWSVGGGDLTIGRQAIAFGAARMVNPTDVFLPFDVKILNTEYKTGVDALRYQYPLGTLSELDIGYVAGPHAKWNDSGAYVQLKTSIAGRDWSFNLMRYGSETLVGAGLETSLGDFGAWFELTHVEGQHNYARASAGVDYGLTDNAFAMLEYHYNGAGTTDSRDYFSLLSTTAWQKGGVFLFGRHYLMPSLSVQLSPLLSSSLSLVWNLDDDSSYTSWGLDYNAREDLYLGVGYQFFHGDPPRSLNTNLPVGINVPGSEYGASPDNFYVRLAWYF
ncbi:MAG: hypothetical protein KDI36_19310, partial [Pseudomonadales bacterium]|nr:hypothetical protein [Pseudomonadales bacterium]